jgi:AcrR family transcriptional regulator
MVSGTADGNAHAEGRIDMPPRAGRTKTRAGESTRRPRGSLSSEEIVKGAFELATLESVDELSMPRLGRHLGVGVTSIYWYFRSKEELFGALTEEAARRFHQLLPEFEQYPWDEHMREYCRAFRRIFQDNPVLCDLIILRAPLQSEQAMLRYFTRLDREIAVLLKAGFPTEQAVRAYKTLSVYTRGCILQERLHTLAGRPRDRDDSTAFEGVVDPETLPAMAQAAKYWSASFATDPDFEAGLSTIIDGLRTQLAELKKAERAARRRANSG